MARIRALKPEFWSDSKMVKLSAFARLFYMGLWNFALCDNGHLPDDADDLKLKILPADPVDAAELLAELIALGRVQRLTGPDGRTWLQMPRLGEHQKRDPRWKPRCPYCALDAAAAEPPPTQPPEPPAPPEDPPQSSPKLADTHPSTPEHTETLPSKGREGKGRVKPPRVTPAPPPPAPDPDPDAADAAPEVIVGTIVEPEHSNDPPSGSAETRTPPGPHPGNSPGLPAPLAGSHGAVVNAGTITAQWIDHCASNRVKLPRGTAKRYAAAIKAALDQGFAPDLIKRALVAMLADNEAARPSLFENYLVRAQTGPPRPPRRLTPGERTADRFVNGDNGTAVRAVLAGILDPTQEAS